MFRVVVACRLWCNYLALSVYKETLKLPIAYPQLVRLNLGVLG